jgi:hypothetical protein
MFITVWKLLDIFVCLCYAWMAMYLAVFTVKDFVIPSEIISNYFEVFFLFSMIFEFVTDFKKEGEHESEKDL